MSCSACGCRDNVICLFQGDAYLDDDDRAVCITGAGCNWPDGLLDAKMVLNPVSAGCGCPFNSTIEITGEVSQVDDEGNTVTPRACFDVTAKQSAALALGHHAYRYSVIATTINGNQVTLDRGRVSVR